MDKYREIRERIGKDLKMKLPKIDGSGYGEIALDWKWCIGLDTGIFQVADEYRRNELSRQETPYIVVYLQGNNGRIFPNVHNYVAYLLRILDGNKKAIKLADYNFIYVWNKESKKLIVVWESDRGANRYRIGECFAKSWLNNEEFQTAKRGEFGNLEIVKESDS